MRVRPDLLRAARRRARPIAVRTGRLTLAAVVSYLVARAVFDTPQPLTGPLTALLVVQATLYSTLTTGLRRVLSVVAGVLVAVLLSSVVGLTWWSLGGAIAASIVIGQALRLGDHLLEVPISAMLVLSVSSAEVAGYARVAETLVGAGIGVLVNVLLPPNLRTGSAAASVQRVADDAAGLLDRVAAELPDGVSADQARGWLSDFRGLNRAVETSDRALQSAADSRRLNPRAVGTVDTGPVLRSGLDALEHSTVALRALFRSLADGLPQTEAEPADPEGYDVELRSAFAVLLADLGGCIRTFGALVRAEASGQEAEAEVALRAALEALRETRVRVTELLLVDAADDARLWQLRGSLLAAVERVLVELDVEERARRRRQWLTEAQGRRSHRLDAVRARAAARRRQVGRSPGARGRPRPPSPPGPASGPA
jgi:hypothetical protein